MRSTQGATLQDIVANSDVPLLFMLLPCVDDAQGTFCIVLSREKRVAKVGLLRIGYVDKRDVFV